MIEHGESRAISILVVDDDLDSFRATTKILQLSGYEVTYANDYHAAVEARTKKQFDVMLIDMALCGHSGISRLCEMLERGACSAIAVTGYGSDRDIESYEEAGFAACLIKPIQPNELLATIQRVLAGGASDIL